MSKSTSPGSFEAKNLLTSLPGFILVEHLSWPSIRL